MKMFVKTLYRSFGFAWLFLACTLAVHAQTANLPLVKPVVYVLDSAGHTVTALDPVKGLSIASATVSGHETKGVQLIGATEAQIDTLVVAAGGARLVRIDSGEAKITVRYGMHPLEESSITILDAGTLQTVAHIDLGWGLAAYQLTPDGKALVAILSGYKSKKPEEALPSEIAVVDLLKGQLTAHIELPRQPVSFSLSHDGATAAIFFGDLKYQGGMIVERASYTNAGLQFFDLATLSAQGQLTFDGSIESPLPSADGAYLYLIDRGQASNKPEKNVNGKIHVVSLQEKKEVATLDAGASPGETFSDEESGNLLLLSKGDPVKGEKNVDGEVRLLRGPSIPSILKVASAPQFVRVSPDRKRLYIVSPSAISVFDYPALRELGRISIGKPSSDLAFDPKGKLGFVLHPESSQLTILDLDAMRQTASVTTGRAGVKFVKAAGAVALTAASATAAYGQAYNMAQATGGVGYAPYQVFTVAPAHTSIAVKPDGAYVYVLNSQTNDVTVVKTGSGEVTAKIPDGGVRLQMLSGGSVLAIVGRKSIRRIDTVTQQALADLPCDGQLLGFDLSPSGQSAVALTEGSVLLLDGATGELRKRIDGFKHPSVVLFSAEPPTQAATLP